MQNKAPPLCRVNVVSTAPQPNPLPNAHQAKAAGRVGSAEAILLDYKVNVLVGAVAQLQVSAGRV